MSDPRERMPIRRMEFGFADNLELIFFRNDPVLSYSSHAFWMTMPYLEPYLMRSVRAAISAVSDPVLHEEMRRFCAQEGQHYQQHAKVNDILRARLPNAEKLREIEAELEADYKHFSADRDHAFNLAYAEAFESMTMAMSRTQMEMRVQDHMSAPIRDLFLWHITEEMEHRTVAFDAYQALGKGYWYRVKTGWWAQRHYLGYVRRFLECFLEIDAERVATVQTPQMIADRNAFRRAFNRRNTPRLLATFMPWYHPAKVRMPRAFAEARAQYSQQAVSIG
jgi:predicted metal-dependent hydrolase